MESINEINENYKAWIEINRDSENFHDPNL